jgi:hypothetical protein
MRLSTSGAYTYPNYLADVQEIDSALASATASRQAAAYRELLQIRVHPATPPEWRAQLAFRMNNAFALVGVMSILP